MSDKRPDFIVIGAMKCATTTLYDQLSAQPGIFMPELKEPNFFSDDDQYSKGLDWYWKLFQEAADTDLVGEASTHYTKLPDYPDTLARLTAQLPGLKLIYVMRHPIDRLVSQYVHEWTQGNISVDINTAVERHPQLIAYSRYSYQLQPYLDFYGYDSVLPVFFEAMGQEPLRVLQEVCEFIGYARQPEWKKEIAPSNVSSERIRRFPFYDLLVDAPAARFIRRNLIPKSIRNRIRSRFQMQERPELSEAVKNKLRTIFDQDLAILGVKLGLELNCDNFRQMVADKKIGWKK